MASECEPFSQPHLLIRIAREELGCMWICGGLEDDRLTMASQQTFSSAGRSSLTRAQNCNPRPPTLKERGARLCG